MKNKVVKEAKAAPVCLLIDLTVTVVTETSPDKWAVSFISTIKYFLFISMSCNAVRILLVYTSRQEAHMKKEAATATDNRSQRLHNSTNNEQIKLRKI